MVCRATRYVYIYIYKNAFFLPLGIFFSSGRASFLVLAAPWNIGSPPGPRSHLWALAEVRGTCSGGSRWQVRSERDSEHVEPSRSKPTYLISMVYFNLDEKKSPTVHVISMMLNFVNIARYYLVMDRYFPDT